MNRKQLYTIKYSRGLQVSGTTLVNHSITASTCLPNTWILRLTCYYTYQLIGEVQDPNVTRKRFVGKVRDEKLINFIFCGMDMKFEGQ